MLRSSFAFINDELQFTDAESHAAHGNGCVPFFLLNHTIKTGFVNFAAAFSAPPTLRNQRTSVIKLFNVIYQNGFQTMCARP